MISKKNASREPLDIIHALNGASSSIAITSALGKYIYMNAAHSEMFGYADEELIGQSWETLYDEDSLAYIHTHVFPEIQKRGFWRGELRGTAKCGRIVYQEVVLDLLEGGGLLCSTRDIGDRLVSQRNAWTEEMQLRRTEGVSVFKTVIASLAHDLSNTLSASLGYSNLLKLHIKDEKLIEYCDAIIKSNRSSLSLIEELDADVKFEPQTSDIDVNKAINTAVVIAQGLIKPNLHIVTELPDHKIASSASALSLTRALINIIKNSDEAQETGIISVALKSTGDIEPGFRHTHQIGTTPNSECWVIEIKDAGHGIPRDDLPKIFEFGHTTKEQISNHGIGMSSVEALLDECVSTIVIESENGIGTRILLYLNPPAEDAHGHARQENEVETIKIYHPEKSSNVAIIDDDETTLQILKASFLRRGLLADTFKDGQEFLLSDITKFDLLITDYHMPKLSGVEVAKQFKQINENAPVIGYSGVRRVAAGSVFDLVLKKPLDLEKLIEHTQDQLMKRAGAES